MGIITRARRGVAGGKSKETGRKISRKPRTTNDVSAELSLSPGIIARVSRSLVVRSLQVAFLLVYPNGLLYGFAFTFGQVRLFACARLFSQDVFVVVLRHTGTPAAPWLPLGRGKKVAESPLKVVSSHLKQCGKHFISWES